MARRIPDETLQAIRDRLSLVEVISAYVNLKRAGRNFVGLCPFHGEKTPSFTVSEERGLYHCFGCGESGTVFTFVMKVERVEFLDAVAQLAKRAGVALPLRDEDDPAVRRREQLLAANAAADRYFRAALAGQAGAAARRYLAERGLQAQTIARYGLGWAPAGGAALVPRLRAQGVSVEAAVQAGVLGRREDGSLFDRFRGRVMFPIRDRRGRTIAFGGRTLGDDLPKYLNSPESPLFRKGEGLYGLAEAREAIRAADRVVLVEGYLDALVLAQEGVPYVVATLGTALTAAQLGLLRPLGGERLDVCVCFDGDRAGRQAALRAFGIAAEAGVWGRAAFLPEGFDPDSYVRARGGAAMIETIEEAPSLLDHYFDTVAVPAATLPERMRVAEDVKRLLARVGDEVYRGLMARRAGERLGLSEGVFRRVRVAPAAAPVATKPTPVAPNWPAEERLLVEIMAADGSVAADPAVRSALARFTALDLRAVAEELVAAGEDERPLGEVIDRLSPALVPLVSAAALGQGQAMSGDERNQAVADCVRRIEERAARAARQRIAAELRQAETSGGEESRERIAQLNDELRRRAVPGRDSI